MVLDSAGSVGQGIGLQLVPRGELKTALEAALVGQADPLRPPRCQPLPLVSSSVAAGFPSPADDYIESRIDLNDVLIRHPSSTFFLRVSGESMRDAGILDGDLLVVDRAVEPGPAGWVVAVVEGPSRSSSSTSTRAAGGWRPPIPTTRPWS
jgi:SOS-response transcriptional repressor LexA